MRAYQRRVTYKAMQRTVSENARSSHGWDLVTLILLPFGFGFVLPSQYNRCDKCAGVPIYNRCGAAAHEQGAEKSEAV